MLTILACNQEQTLFYMKLHLLSKVAGPLHVEDAIPDLPFITPAPPAIPYATTWNGNNLIIQTMITTSYSIHLIDLAGSTTDELVAVLPAAFIAVHFSLKNSVNYTIDWLHEPVTLHERGHHVLTAPWIDARITVRPVHHRSLLITFTKAQFDQLAGNHTKANTFAWHYDQRKAARLTRYNQVTTPEMMRMVQQLQTAESDTKLNDLCTKLLTRCLNPIAATNHPAGPVLSQSDIDKLYKAKEFITTNPSLNFKNEDIAASGGISRYQLLTWFPKIFGVTPQQYILEYKMELAAKMLLSSQDYTLETIAKMLGYYSASTFHRSFKSYYEQLPTEFAHRVRKKLTA